MATIIKSISRFYYYMNDEISDPRTRDWFLMSNPWPGIAILWFYFYFVFNLGPRLMEKRPAFDLHRVLQIYNVIQIMCNLYLVYKALTLAWLHEYSFYCEPVDYSYDPHAIEIAWTVWIYFIVKLIDLADTVFFVLRKKNSQISFLHVYHHAGMVIGSWAGVKYLPGGHGTFLGMVNSFVHVVMYTHYLATSMKISSPWWKKYITQLQLTQFVIILYHFSQLLWIDCGFPAWSAAIFIPQNLFMIVLFGDFYYKTYLKKKTPKLDENGIDNGISNGNKKIK